MGNGVLIVTKLATPCYLNLVREIGCLFLFAMQPTYLFSFPLLGQDGFEKYALLKIKLG